MPLRSIHSARNSNGTAQLRLVPKGERKSLEDVIEETRLSPRWAAYFPHTFQDPYLHLTPEQYAEVAEQNGFGVLSTHTAAKAWDFQSRAAFEAFGSVTLLEWSQHIPEAERSAFVTDVLDRYQRVAADAPGEETTFASTRWISSSPPSRGAWGTLPVRIDSPRQYLAIWRRRLAFERPHPPTPFQ